MTFPMKKSTESLESRQRKMAEGLKKVPPHLRARVLGILQRRRQRALDVRNSKD